MQKLAYTYEEAAAQCGYSVRTLKQAASDGNLALRYANTEGVIRHEDLAGWIGQLPTKPTGDASPVKGDPANEVRPTAKDAKPATSQQDKSLPLPLPRQEGEWLTPEDLAKMWQFSPGTIANWRNQGKGPEYVRFGGSVVRYSPEAVKAWVEKQPKG
jgi:predicted DNA-binding transcriptional regulator AlpA